MDLSKPGNQAWSDLVTSLSASGHRAWWYARDGSLVNKETGGFYGLEESLASIGTLIRATGPVHAIWGFSQGACFAGMLCALFQDRLAEHPLRQHLGVGTEVTVPKAGVIFSGFRARFPQYDSLYETMGIEVPTLHVIGEKDEAVRGERSQQLIEVCSEAETLGHPGGHDIPKSPADQQRIAEFLRRYVGGEQGTGEKFQASM
jgi:predicted esterase